MINIPLPNYLDFKNEVITKALKQFSYKKGGRYFLIAIDGPMYFTHSLSKQNEQDYITNLAVTANKKVGDDITVSPFASKEGLTFKGEGFYTLCPSATVTDIDFTVPTGNYLFNALEILNGSYGDTVQLQIIDTTTGTYSTVPNYVLDQFGNNWNMRKELVKTLPYDAKIFEGMVVRVKYANNGGTAKNIYVNLDLHKVVV